MSTTHTYMTNRYPGTCPCGANVAAGEGIYSRGSVYCNEQHMDITPIHTHQPNRYAGRCSCGANVEAGAGIYFAGATYCDEPVWQGGDVEWDGETIAVEVVGCPTLRRREARLYITSRRERIAYEASEEGQQRAAAIAERAARNAAARAEQDATWAAHGLERCGRCGGAGGSSHWPGYTCYDCGGDGAVHTH